MKKILAYFVQCVVSGVMGVVTGRSSFTSYGWVDALFASLQ